MSEEKKIDVKNNPIGTSGNCYILFGSGDSKNKQITNFIMKPLNGIQSDNEQYFVEIEFTLSSGRKFVKQLSSTAFSSTQKFKTAIKNLGGIDMTFDGTESNLSDIQKYMTAKYANYNHCQGIDYIGLYRLEDDWVYVGTDGAINKKGAAIDSIVSVVEDNEALKSVIIDAKMPNASELQSIVKDLFCFNSLDRTINIIGWVCVCFLKERLRKRKIKLSHLVLEGAAGSGKSETLEKVIQPIFGLIGSGIGCSGITKFSVLKSTSSTNLLPVIFEEYKPHKLSKIEQDLISGTLRSVYDYQTSQRGRTDQSVVNYMRRSPIIVVGESSFDESAVKERIIDVQFAKSDRTEEHTEHFKSICKKEKILNKLGKALLLFAMNIPDDVLDDLIQRSRIFDDTEFETRVILGISNVYLGLLFLQDLFDSYHLDLWKMTGINQKIIRDTLITNTKNAMDGNSSVHSAVDNIIEVFDTMALKHRIREKIDFTVNHKENELCLRLNIIYDEFTKYMRETNRTDIDMLPARQFTKQLKKESYYKDYLLRNFLNTGNDGKDEEIRIRCFVLNLDMLNKSCSLEAFKAEESEYPVDNDGFIIMDESNQEELPFT